MIHKCYTYYSLRGDYPLNEVVDLFSNVEIGNVWAKGTKKNYGDDLYSDSNVQTKKYEDMGGLAQGQFDLLMDTLREKENSIICLKKEHPISTCFEIVPTLTNHRGMQIIIPHELLRFCHTTDSKIDIDYYVCDNSKYQLTNYCCSKLILNGEVNNEAILTDVFKEGNSEKLDHSREYGTLPRLILGCKQGDVINTSVLQTQTVKFIQPYVEDIKSMILKHIITAVFVIEVQVVNQMSRPLVSPTKALIEFCNYTGADLSIMINTNYPS